VEFGPDHVWQALIAGLEGEFPRERVALAQDSGSGDGDEGKCETGKGDLHFGVLFVSSKSECIGSVKLYLKKVGEEM